MELMKEDAVKETRACVIYDATCGRGPGYEVALSERRDIGQQVKTKIETEGFQAHLESEKDPSGRLWYLKTDAPFETLWSVLNEHLDAYVRFEVLPRAGMRVSDSFGGVRYHSLAA